MKTCDSRCPRSLTASRFNERAGHKSAIRWNLRPNRPSAAAAGYLARLQQRDGHWCAELTADTTLESDYILFQLWLYPPQDGSLGSAEPAR